MGRILGFAALAFAGACSWPATRMEPVYNYGSGPRVTVSSAPAYTAGPSTARTTSPDGATLFVCDSGGTMPGWWIPPGFTPAC